MLGMLHAGAELLPLILHSGPGASHEACSPRAKSVSLEPATRSVPAVLITCATKAATLLAMKAGPVAMAPLRPEPHWSRFSSVLLLLLLLLRAAPCSSCWLAGLRTAPRGVNGCAVVPQAQPRTCRPCQVPDAGRACIHRHSHAAAPATRYRAPASRPTFPQKWQKYLECWDTSIFLMTFRRLAP